MTLGPEESLEDYEEIFQLNYRRAKCTLDPGSLKLVLLRGIREDILETLNMMSGGDIYQLPYEDIKIVFKNSSKAARKKGRASQALVSSSPPQHPSIMKLGTCWRTLKVKCCIPLLSKRTSCR